MRWNGFYIGCRVLDTSMIFVLKRALLLTARQAPSMRPTKDIDLEGVTINDAAHLIALFFDVLAADIEPDGPEFDRESLQTELNAEAAYFTGVRLRFTGNLDTADDSPRMMYLRHWYGNRRTQTVSRTYCTRAYPRGII
jgi:hypothetical protein